MIHKANSASSRAASGFGTRRGRRWLALAVARAVLRLSVSESSARVQASGAQVHLAVVAETAALGRLAPPADGLLRTN